MLVVRHIERSGHESIMCCNAVSFDPAVGEKQEWPKGQVLVFGCNPSLGGAVDEHGTCRYGDGRLYVMSVEGRTVASYDLD